MAVKQYIGARYVPLFMGEHDINKSYEALSIVTDAGATSSYTSKKPVPVGIALTNTEYWALTGTMSGAILNLQNRMSEAEADIISITDNVNALGNLNALRGHILLIGDSYVAASNPSWADYIGQYLGKTKNVDYFISARSGVGFANTIEGVNFATLVNSAVVDDEELITAVIVQGGSNDIYSQTINNIEAGIATFCENVKTRFKNASVFIGMCDGWIDSAYNVYIRDSLYIHYMAGAISNGAYFMGATGTGLKLFRTTMLQSDLKHPTNAGEVDIAKRSLASLTGIPYVSAVTNNGTYYFKEVSTDLVEMIFIGNYNYTLASASSIVCDGAHAIEIPLANHNISYQESYESEWKPLVLISTSNIYYDVNARYEITHSGLKVYPRLLNSTGSDFETINVSRLTVPAISMKTISHLIG